MHFLSLSKPSMLEILSFHCAGKHAAFRGTIWPVPRSCWTHIISDVVTTVVNLETVVHASSLVVPVLAVAAEGGDLAGLQMRRVVIFISLTGKSLG